MQNFDYCTPTRLIFGKGVVKQLPAVMAQFGKKVLLTYGGGSIKKIGLYQKVLELLQLAAVQYWTAPRRLRQAPARHDPRHTFRHIRLLSCHFIGSKTFANFVIV